MKVNPAFGRRRTYKIGDKNIVLNLVKNPAGFQSVLRSADAEKTTLYAVNDQYADGRDVSWLYDVDFDVFANKKHQNFHNGNSRE